MELIRTTDVLELVNESGNWPIGGNAGYNPVQLVAVAAAACSTYIFEQLLAERQIAGRALRVVFDYVQDDVYPQPIAQINVQLHMQADRSDWGSVQDVFLQLPEHCPVLQSLHPRIRLNEQIVFSDERPNII
ncbi:MAG: OsmC family protein [Sporolactobacillus sp.]